MSVDQLCARASQLKNRAGQLNRWAGTLAAEVHLQRVEAAELLARTARLEAKARRPPRRSPGRH
jgi:hypothetical protein